MRLAILLLVSAQQQAFQDLGERAVEAVRTARYEDALPLYRKMLVMDPSNDGVRFDLALSLNRLGRARESLKVLGTPRHADAFTLAGADYRLLGQPASAVTVLRKAFALAPSPAIAYDLGLSLLDTGATAEAERIFKRYPEDARCLVGQGLAAYGAGRIDEARKAFEKAALNEPQAADIQASLGDVHASQGRYEDAARHYEASNDRVKAARNLIKLHRDNDAVVLLREVLRQDPLDGDANLELGQLLARESGNAEARRLLETAIAADPAKPNAYYQLMLLCKATADTKCHDFARKGFEHVRNNTQVHMDPPSVILEGPAGERRWGRYQFPVMHRMADGRLWVSVHVNEDSATAYGAPKQILTSADDGLTWRNDPAAEKEAYGFRIREGEYLRIDTPPALEAATLNLPPRVGSFTAYSVEYSAYPLKSLPAELRKIFFQRYTNGQWQPESSTLDDSDGLRYVVQERFPRIWWGDIQRAQDGSLLAVTYPTIAPTPPYRFGSACFRSVDQGKTWTMRGRIPFQPDLAADPKGASRLGFAEPGFTVLKDGSLYAVLRTTDGIGIAPMYETRSRDLGRTWSPAKVIAPNGVLPRLLRLDNGTLVLASGRPGVQLRFSTDNATTWSQPYDLLPALAPNPHTDSCGYTDLIALDRDSFLIVYSWFMKPDTEGKPRKAILARRIRVTNP